MEFGSFRCWLHLGCALKATTLSSAGSACSRGTAVSRWARRWSGSRPGTPSTGDRTLAAATSTAARLMGGMPGSRARCHERRT